MSEHECIIGLLYDDGYFLIEVKELKEHIKEVKEYNQSLDEQEIKIFRAEEYTLKDYCDKRKSTNLTRFEFCPYCGKKIDWKKIKNEEKE